MFANTFHKIGLIHRELLTDDSSRLSLAKCMLYFGWLFLTCFIWKLILTHTLTIEYFVVYAGFVSGHHLVSKFIDNKGDQIETGTGGG
jgi:hypothetical protein